MREGALRVAMSMGLALLPLVLLGCGARTQLGVLHDLDGGSDRGVDAGDARSPTTCRVNTPTLLYSAGGQPSSLVVDQLSVYWSDYGRVQAIDKAGVNYRRIASGRNWPTGITLAGDFVYWGEWQSGLVVRGPTSGQGTLDVLAASLSEHTSDVAVLGADVYWSNYNGGTVARLLGSSSSPELVAQGDGAYTAIATDGRFVFYAAQWITQTPTGSIHRFDPTTLTITKLADNLSGAPWSVATDGVNVYFNELFSKNKTAVAAVGESGGPTSVLAEVAVDSASCPGGGCEGAVATDGRFVYFTSDEGDGSVRKVPVTGGAPIVLAEHQAQPYGVAVDDNCVYWCNYADGTIMIAPK